MCWISSCRGLPFSTAFEIMVWPKILICTNCLHNPSVASVFLSVYPAASPSHSFTLLCTEVISRDAAHKLIGCGPPGRTAKRGKPIQMSLINLMNTKHRVTKLHLCFANSNAKRCDGWLYFPWVCVFSVTLCVTYSILLFKYNHYTITGQSVVSNVRCFRCLLAVLGLTQVELKQLVIL